MTEPVFKGTTPDGRWVITVDCALSEDGEPTDWTGAVVLDGQNIIDVIRTQDSDKLVRWTHRQMVEAMRRSALPERTTADEPEAGKTDS